MKRFLLGWMVAAAMGLAAPWSAAAAETPASEPAETARTKQMYEAERARIEKQLTDAKKKLLQLQQNELELSVKTLTAESDALKAVEDPKQLTPPGIKGSTAKGVPEYRNMCMACAEQWGLMEAKYAAVHRNLQAVERKRDSMSDDLKASLDEVLATVLKHRCDLMEKMAVLYTKIADDKRTLGVYAAIHQLLPHDLANLNRMAALYKNMGDYKQALALYMDIQGQSPKDFINLRNMAEMYEKLGDYKKALEKYMEAKEQHEEDPTNTTDLGRMYAKLGAYQQAVAAYDKVAQKISGNVDLERKLAGLYEEAGALQKALALYLKVSEALSPDQRQKDENLKQSIERLKRKLRQ